MTPERIAELRQLANDDGWSGRIPIGYLHEALDALEEARRVEIIDGVPSSLNLNIGTLKVTSDSGLYGDIHIVIDGVQQNMIKELVITIANPRTVAKITRWITPKDKERP